MTLSNRVESSTRRRIAKTSSVSASAILGSKMRYSGDTDRAACHPLLQQAIMSCDRLAFLRGRNGSAERERRQGQRVRATVASDRTAHRLMSSRIDLWTDPFTSHDTANAPSASDSGAKIGCLLYPRHAVQRMPARMKSPHT